MTDHWKDVQPIYPFSESPHCDDGPACYFADSVDAARAKDAAERAEREAAYEARVQRDHDEIVELTTEIARLRARVHEDVHLRAVVELYRSNPMEMAAALVRLRDAVSALRAGAEETNA